MAAALEFQQLLSLMLREREMLEDYGKDHPDVQKIRKQLETAQAYLQTKALPESKKKGDYSTAELVQSHVGLLENDLLQLERREKELAAISSREEEEAKKLVSAELRDEMLRTDIVRKRGLYDAIIDRLKKINLVKDYGGYLTQVISRVETPRSSVSPILLLVLAIGTALGLLAGGGLAYVVDVADRTFRNPDEVRRALSLPLLADVPPIGGGKNAAADTPTAHGKIDQRVVCHYRPMSREAESIRGLRTALYFSTRRDGRKVLQVTSPNAGDGKATISSNLAVSLAQSGKKVLLVDADMRRPMVARIFGIEPSAAGLSSVILEETQWPDAIRDVGIANLSILPAGVTPPNPSELLLSPRFEGFLAAVRQQYDYVLIDSPPVLAVSDAMVIAPWTDGVVLTIRVATNAAPSALQAKRMLDSVDAKTLGIIVNGFQKDRNYGCGYYRYGERGYGFGYQSSSSTNGNSRYYPEDKDGAMEKTGAEKMGSKEAADA